MWSYKDSQNQIHSNLSIEDIRKLIDAGSITETTSLKNAQFADWQEARHTTFFLTDTEDLPSKNHQSLPSLAPPPNISAQREKGNHRALIFYSVITLISLAPLIAFTTLAQIDLVSIKQLETERDTVKFFYVKKSEAEADLQTAKNDVAEYDRKLSTPNYDTEVAELLSQRVTEAREKLANYTVLPEIPQTEPQINSLKAEVKKNHQFAAYAALGLLIPIFFSLPQYIKALPILNKSGPKILNLGIVTLQLIPVIQLLVYLVYSGKWNVEGSQRKNNLLYTFPLSVATIVCYYLTAQQFQAETQDALFLLIAGTILMICIHMRFLQMLEYAENKQFTH